MKRTRVAPDGQQPQSEGFATPPFNLSDFGDNLARGVLEGVAKLQSASAQGLAKVVSTGRYADSADTDSEEKALQRRIHVIRREQFHLLKFNNPDDQKEMEGVHRPGTPPYLLCLCPCCATSLKI